jgi:glutathione S-transferase
MLGDSYSVLDMAVWGWARYVPFALGAQAWAQLPHVKRLLDAGIMVADGDRVTFAKDHLFRSPTMAAVALIGRTTNGWLQWKTQDGRTLDEIERSDPAS